MKNFADVSTMEGAVASGVTAAEAARKAAGSPGNRIELLMPEAYPREVFQALRVAWAPYAAMAKAWSTYSDGMKAVGVRLPGLSDPFRSDSRILKELDRALKEVLKGPKLPPELEGLGPLYWGDKMPADE
ncbi:MAG: hypothetical protein AAFW69_02515 [Pseudomonadota bacterium]